MKMFNYLRPAFNTQVKFHCFNAYNHKFYSVLSCNKTYCDLKRQKKNERSQIKPLPQQQQFRFLSQSNVEIQNLPFYDKIASSELSSSVRNVLMGLHDDLSIPWWSCIVLTTFIVKFSFTLVFGIYQQHVGAKIKLSKVELGDAIKNLQSETWQMAVTHRWTEKKQKQYFNSEVHKAWSDIVVKNNCHPFKLFILSYLQLPIWLLLSINLRKLTIDAPPNVLTQLSNEGPFWTSNLLLPDSYFLCPLIIGASNLALAELNNLLMPGDNQKLTYKMSKYILRFVSIIGVLIAMMVPSALSFYWATSSFYSFCQFFVFLSPRVKRLCGIPKTPFDIDTPYRNIYLSIRKKFGR